jgi:hypothetical protein
MRTSQERTLGRSETTVTKVAVIIGAILLLAGVATAGTVAGLGSSDDSPTVSIPAVGTTTGETGTTTSEDRRENELRGRENEPGEDVRGPCDELEHANDPRCTGVQTLEDDDRGERRGRGRDDADDNRREDRSGPSDNSGPGSVDSGDDDRGGGGRGGHSGRGGGDDD